MTASLGARMTESELRDIEEAAAELARGAGKLLMGYFQKPLEVTYKSPNQRNPVTDADKAADAYLHQEVSRRFPGHAVLSEETIEDQAQEAEVIWVVDPLDGTVNFLNGLPIFGVSIGVLERGRPVVGAIFIPSIHTQEGAVLHARTGGGAFCDDVPLNIESGQLPGNGLLSAMPSYFWRGFSFRTELRRRLGEVRSTGSVAYELAHVARGVFQYALFGGPWIWDVAGGIVLVQEAGGVVLVRQPKSPGWTPFQGFGAARGRAQYSQSELRQWRGAILVGTPQAAAFVAQGLRLRSLRWLRWWRRIGGWWARRSGGEASASGSQGTESAEKPGGTESPSSTDAQERPS